MSVVFLFPGQGSQKVGMGADLSDAFDEARRRFRQADEILGRGLSAICFKGPEEALKATENTQPAIFTVEAVLFDLLRQRGLTPSLCMGHSLGEYAALYAAGAFSFEDGFRMVAARGELMAKAGRDAPGAMAAVIGLAPEAITSVLSKVTAGIVVAANENSPDQTVISGEVKAVAEACELLRNSGAKKAIALQVSGAFHSPLMQNAADEFRSVVSKVTFQTPRCPVISNVTARPESEPGLFPEILVRQLVSPVRWVESVRTASAQGATSWYEIGPGNVLQGLVKKTAPAVNVIPCSTAENVYSLSPSA